MKQEHSTDNAKQDAVQPAGCAGSVSMTDASAKSAPDPNGVTAMQEQQNGPVPKSPQQSRAVTPELKIERLDVRTGQVRCLHILPSKSTGYISAFWEIGPGQTTQ